MSCPESSVNGPHGTARGKVLRSFPTESVDKPTIKLHNPDRLGRQSAERPGRTLSRMYASPRRISRPRQVVALAAALTVLLAACGDDDDASSATTEADPASTTTPATTAPA